MAQYEIKHEWLGRVDIETRKRRDAAEYLFRNMARNELVAGSAGLDTAWGWQLCRAAWRIAGDVLAGVPIGWSATLEMPAHCQSNERLTLTRLA